MDTERRLMAARSALLFMCPFFGALSINMGFHDATDNSEVNTMATDGVKLYYDSAFVAAHNKEELMFILAHEAKHVADEHHCRRNGRNLKKWNIATDYAINGELIACGVGKPPKGILHDPQYDGMTAEEIYRLLPDDDGSDDGGNDPGQCGQVLDAADPNDKAGMEQAKAAAKSMVAQAAAMAKKIKETSPDTMSDALERMIDDMSKPTVDWRAVMRQFFDGGAESNYTWSNPNRLFLGRRIVIPGVVSEGISHLVYAIDTSGSMDVEALDKANAEVKAAFDEGIISRLTVIYADTNVRRVDEFTHGDYVEFNAKGGGGTAFADTFDWIRSNATDAAAVVYFTDLHCSLFGEAPEAPLLWAVYGDSREFNTLSAAAPFGEAIYIQP